MLLTLTATRILSMNHDEELAWRLTRSAKVVALLEKPIERVAQAASLSIIDSLDEISVDLLTEWLETGRSSFVGHIEKQWRLRRDSGCIRRDRAAVGRKRLSWPIAEGNQRRRPCRPLECFLESYRESGRIAENSKSE